MMLQRRVVLSVMAWCGLWGTCDLSVRAAEVPARELLSYLPDSINVVAVVRVEQLLRSPRGQAEDWAIRQQERFLAGASSIPPHVETMVLGMQVRPQTSEMVSSISLASMASGVQLEPFSKREGDAVLELVGGCTALQSRYNAFYIELSPTVLAVVSPAIRQEASRYVRHVIEKPNAPLPTSYLGQVAQMDHQIIVAMDLLDMGNPHRIQGELERLEGVKGNAPLMSELQGLLATLKGVRFSADVNQATTARLTVDFGQEPKPSAVVLKAMVLRIIGDAGLHISELEDAVATVEGRSLVLSLPQFSDASLRMVLSLISPSAPLPEVSKPVSPPLPARTSQPTPRVPEATASLRYLRTVNQCLDDLQQANKRNRDPGQNATWHENMARKIEKLPVTGVDPDLITYGVSMSSRLRALAASLKGVAIEVDTVEKSIVWKSTFDPGYSEANIWGGFGYRAPTVQYDSNLDQVRERQAEAVVRGEKDRLSAWLLINEERQSVTTQINVRFGQR